MGAKESHSQVVTKEEDKVTVNQIERNNKKIIANSEKESEESLVLTIKKKNNHDFEDYELIDNVILKHFFMRALDKASRKEIIKEMSLCSVKNDTIIFKQGSIGNYFYIIKEGKVDLIINDKLIKTIGSGESFGELALIRSSPRSGTIKTTKETTIWCLQRRAFRKIVNFINQLNFEENKKFIQTIPVLANIENDQKIALCNNLIKESYDKQALIVKENDIANCIYLIKDGEVDCGSKGKVVRTLKKGDIFGENSILIDTLRSMDVVAKTNCILYSISIETLKLMAGEKYKEALFLNLIKLCFSKSRMFNKISPAMLESIFPNFTVKKASKAQTILGKGELKSSNLICIISGNVINSSSSELIGERGSLLFEDEVYNYSKEAVKNDLIADPDCLYCLCKVDVFLKNLGGSFQEICEQSDLIGSLKKVPLFRNFPLKKLEILTSAVKIEKFSTGEKIIVQGEMSNKFYILKSGKIDIFVSGNYIRTLNPNEYFGDRALFFNEARSATAKAKEATEVYVLDKEDFKKNIESNLKDYLINRFYLQDNTVELNDLEYIKELGSGNFGAVSLVVSKQTKYYYAIKSISKKQIDYEQLHKNLDLERSILLQIDHPFIVKLVKTLKDNKFIYFLMEYIKGKELFDTIRDIGLLNKVQTNFYCCSMMLAVEYLHERKFIYRDLKPENIIVTEKGFIKLIDFGTAKIISDRASTIIGTPHYMAPEVILGEGYSFNVDYWSIFICMYEFVCGGVPFGETAEDPMDVYLAIINDSLNFPNFMKDKEFKNLITLTLNKNTLQRLCKLALIKKHPWFSSFNWDELITMNLEPPYIPKLSKENLIPVKPYLNYVKTIKDWIPTKEVTFDVNTLQEYEKWHQEF